MVRSKWGETRELPGCSAISYGVGSCWEQGAINASTMICLVLLTYFQSLLRTYYLLSGYGSLATRNYQENTTEYVANDTSWILFLHDGFFEPWNVNWKTTLSLSAQASAAELLRLAVIESITEAIYFQCLL